MGRYLVTGCAGFIGAKVAELLLEAGNQVVGVDNLNDAYDPRLKKWRLERLMRLPAFRFLELDIANRAAIEELFETESKRSSADIPQTTTDMQVPAGSDDAPFNGVLNLAARAGVRPSVENPWVYYEANCTGTLNLLELCRRFGVRKFVLASTSSLYGKYNKVPYSEDDDTNRPLSPYAASKKAAETLCFTYHHLYGLDITIPRYFTVYGPAGRPDMCIFRFIRWIAEGEPLQLYGDGSQQRDFTYVDDIARGTIACLKSCGYEVVNLGGDRPVALNTVIDWIAKLVDREPIIQRHDAHPADVPATWANITKAKQLLGWQPTVPLEEGLKRCVEWYRENRELVLNLQLDPV